MKMTTKNGKVFYYVRDAKNRESYYFRHNESQALNCYKINLKHGKVMKTNKLFKKGIWLCLWKNYQYFVADLDNEISYFYSKHEKDALWYYKEKLKHTYFLNGNIIEYKLIRKIK
jgi:hypothetical protein